MTAKEIHKQLIADYGTQQSAFNRFKNLNNRNRSWVDNETRAELWKLFEPIRLRYDQRYKNYKIEQLARQTIIPESEITALLGWASNVLARSNNLLEIINALLLVTGRRQNELIRSTITAQSVINLSKGGQTIQKPIYLVPWSVVKRGLDLIAGITVLNSNQIKQAMPVTVKQYIKTAHGYRSIYAAIVIKKSMDKRIKFGDCLQIVSEQLSHTDSFSKLSYLRFTIA